MRKFKFTPNTAKNRQELRRVGSFGYNVFYWDTDAGKEKCLGARWNPDAQDFDYCDGVLVSRENTPRLKTMAGTPRFNPVTGWAKCSDWEAE